MTHYHMRFGTDLGWFLNERPDESFAYDNIYNLFLNGFRGFDKLYIYKFQVPYELAAVLDVDKRFLELSFRLCNKFNTITDLEPYTSYNPDWFSFQVFRVLDEIYHKRRRCFDEAQGYIRDQILEMAGLK